MLTGYRVTTDSGNLILAGSHAWKLELILALMSALVVMIIFPLTLLNIGSLSREVAAISILAISALLCLCISVKWIYDCLQVKPMRRRVCLSPSAGTGTIDFTFPMAPSVKTAAKLAFPWTLENSWDFNNDAASTVTVRVVDARGEVFWLIDDSLKQTDAGAKSVLREIKAWVDAHSSTFPVALSTSWQVS